MLESKYLRIGNNILFSDDSTIFEVVEIDKNGLHVKNDNEETWIELEHFEGIKLTEEILFSLGFERNMYPLYSKDDFVYNIFNKQVAINKQQITNVDICYLHELQNLYYSLTKKELTLKPLLLPHKTII